MNKKTLTFTVIMIMAGVSTLLSCNKEESSFINETTTMTTKEFGKQDEVSIAVESGEKGEIVDIYHIIDQEKSTWSWRRFENNNFVHDFDFIWQESDDIFSMKENGNGDYVVTFEDGEQTIITDIVSSEYHTTFTFHYESGRERQITITHPSKAAPIDGLVCYTNGGSISFIENGGIWDTVVKFIKDILRDNQQCINEVANKAKECSDAKCIPSISDNCRSVICFPNPFGGSSNCGSHTYSC